MLSKTESVMDMQELYLPIHFIEWVIREMPTADVAEVVRYKDCVYCDDGRCEIHCNDLGMSEAVWKDYFCNYGHRRKKNDNADE